MRHLLVSLDLTDGCNFDCVHCCKTLSREVRFMDLALIRRILAQTTALGLPVVVALTGGEPTLHPELEQIIHDIGEAGHRWSIVTNSWQFSDIQDCVQRQRRCLDAVTFSLDGSNERSHDALRRSGSFRRVVAGLCWCQAHGVRTQVNMVITRDNHNELHDMVELTSRLGCRALGLAHCKPTRRALDKGLVMSHQERRRLEELVAGFSDLYRMPVLLAGDHFNPHPVSLCPQLELQSLHVDVKGRVCACCELAAYRGAAAGSSVIADLHSTTLADALCRLAERTGAIIKAKVDRFESGQMSEPDYFLCARCLLGAGIVTKLDADGVEC